MAHHTYVNIRYRRADDEFHLFLKSPDGTLQYFISNNRAINGRYRYENVKRDLCKGFEIEPTQFTLYYLQVLDIDLSKIIEHKSSSIAELRVDEAFFQKTIFQKEQFEWISKDQLEGIGNLFFEDHSLVFARLQQEDEVINLPADLVEGIRVLQRAHIEQKLVVFAGAGISNDSGTPLWRDLKKGILRTLGQEKISESTDPTVLAQYLYIARGKKEYNEKIKEILGFYKKYRPNEIHKALINLNPKHIITTNFDDLLEKSLPVTSDFSIIKCDQHFPYSSPNKLLVKMHGDWDLMNFVLKEDDYLSYSRNWPLTEGFVRGIFASHVVLFIGFSFDDRNLKQILGWVKDILGNDLQPAYLFLTEDKNEHEQSYFRNKGLHLLSWPENYKVYLKNIGQKSTQGLSILGEKTADFLRFLNEANLVEYERVSKSQNQMILDQMYGALRVFDAFNSLPPYFFERLFPFSPFRLSPNKKQVDATTDRSRLNVSNESIIQLMQSIKFEENSINVKEGAPLSKEIKESDNYPNKLWYVFDKLISSGIKCIHRDGNETHHPIRIHNPFSNRLLFSKWIEFRLNEVLEAIDKREYAFGQSDWIPNPLRDGLLDGYVLYRMNFLDLAYDVFLKVETEAARSGDFALYFLSRRNREKVSWQISWRGRVGDYSESLAEQVRYESEKIDLHETLRTIKVETPVRQLLRDIQEENVLKKFTNEIEDKHAKIMDTFKLFQDPFSFHVGPSFVEYSKWSFENLCWFYDSNGLIPNSDSSFQKAAEIAFESLVASHKTAKRYDNRYVNFQCNSLFYSIRWIATKKLQEILNKFELTEIPFSNGHKEVFIKTAINFLKSGYKEKNAFIGTSENKLFKNYIEKNSLYPISERRIFPNLLKLLALIELDDMPELAIDLCDAVLKSNQYIPHFLSSSDDFILFYQKHLKFMKHKQIEAILDLLRKRHDLQSFPLKHLARKTKEIFPDFRITNQVLFQNLMTLEHGDNETDRLLALVEFYGLLDENLQNKLTNAIQEKLEKPVGLEELNLFFIACFEGCISYKTFPKNILESLKSSFGKICQIRFGENEELVPFESDSDFGGGELPHRYVWIVRKLVQSQSLKLLDKNSLTWLLNQTDLPLCLRWLLSPKSFDYSTFDHFWLLFIEDMDAVLKNLAALKIPAMYVAIQKGLQKRFSQKIAAIYFKYFSAEL